MNGFLALQWYWLRNTIQRKIFYKTACETEENCRWILRDLFTWGVWRRWRSFVEHYHKMAAGMLRWLEDLYGFWLKLIWRG